MQFNEFYCPICEVQMVSPETKDEHMRTCNGNFRGVLLPQDTTGVVNNG